MAKVSIIIPSRNEPYLQRTINSLFERARGDIEIIVILDGYWPTPSLEADDRLILIHRGSPHGMRNGINSAVQLAKGDYLLKCDAHCLFDVGYDEKLIKDCKYNWVMVPRRYELDVNQWDRTEKYWE